MSFNPMTVVGSIGFGVQMCGEIIRGYRFYCEAQTLMKDLPELLVHMRLEQSRFVLFCEDAGLHGDGSKAATELRLHPKLLQDVLRTIKNTLSLGAKKSTKYLPILPSDLSREIEIGPHVVPELIDQVNRIIPIETATETTKRSAVATIATIGNTAVQKIFDGGRLSWASSDSEQLRGIVDTLSALNVLLTSFLSEARLRKFLANTDMLCRVMFQHYIDPAQMDRAFSAFIAKEADPATTKLIASFAESDSIAAAFEARKEARKKEDAYAKKLLELRRKYLLANTAPDGADIPLEAIQLREDAFVMRDRDMKSNRPLRTCNGKYVWIEWKEKIPISSNDDTSAEWQTRLMANLVGPEKPRKFPTPRCPGYIKKREAQDYEYGIVFESPYGVTFVKLKDLREHLLEDTWKPSMTERLKLCSSVAAGVQDFHTVNWIHKSIRSENIIFFMEEGENNSLQTPFIVGFQFSRPSRAKEISRRTMGNPAEELYRHPESGKGAKRYHDLYSLGLLLIEIVLWKPLESLLGIGKLDKATMDKVLEAHGKVRGLLPEVAFIAGDNFAAIVKACLDAGTHDQYLAGDSDSNDNETEVDKRLQALLGDVCSRMHDMSVAMSWPRS